MDTVDLARLQFALTAGAHYLFVALTLGLATLVAVIQTRATFGRSVTLTAYASAFWVMVSNGFLQNPVGYRREGGVLHIADFGAMVANPAALVAFAHILSGALVVGGFLMAGVSAYHLSRRTAEQDFFRKSLRIGVGVSLSAVLSTATFGGIGFQTLQPGKIAAWTGDAERMAQVQAEMTALHGPGDYLPPVGWVQGGALTMLIVFAVMFMLSGLNILLMLFRPVVRGFRLWHRMLIAMIPLPFVAVLGGWIFREMGRQPWTVYGLLTTSDAMSPVTDGQMRFSLVAFTGVFAVLAVINYWLLARAARRGPDGVTLGGGRAAETPERPDPVMTF